MKTETDGMKHPMMQLAGDIANAWEVDLAQANAEMGQSNYPPEVTRILRASWGLQIGLRKCQRDDLCNRCVLASSLVPTDKLIQQQIDRLEKFREDIKLARLDHATANTLLKFWSHNAYQTKLEIQDEGTRMRRSVLRDRRLLKKRYQP